MAQEIYISDYFKNEYNESFSDRDWQEVNKLRNKIDSFENEGEIYNYLYNRRMSAFNRSEDARLFGIPEDATINVNMHADVENKYYTGKRDENRKGSSKKDYFKRDKNGNLELDESGNPVEYGNFMQAILNLQDHLEDSDGVSGGIYGLVNFVIKHPILSLLIVIVPIVLFFVVTIFVYISGCIDSIGHTPFVICDEGEMRGKVKTKNVEEVLEMAQEEYAVQLLVLKMEEEGYLQDAIIGAVSYALGKNPVMGTFTYEGCFYGLGPNYSNWEKTLNNDEWLGWLDTYKVYMHDMYYHNKFDLSSITNRQQHSCFEDGYSLYSSVGIGLFQDSNVWNYVKVWVESDLNNDGTIEDYEGYWFEEPYLVESNATKLIEFAKERGAAWQDPDTQIEWILQRMEQESFWNFENPKDTSEENMKKSPEDWCTKICYGIGIPRNYVTEEEQKEYIKLQVSHVEEARRYYNLYSNSDIKMLKLNGGEKDPCSGMNNTYASGNGSIAQAAVSLSSGTLRINFDERGSSSTNLQNPLLSTYKIVHETIFPGDEFFASCDRSAACAIIWSGSDDNFPRGDTTVQYDHLVKSDRWTYVGKYGSCNVLPGDVLIRKREEGEKHGHIKIYVGNEAVQARFPGEKAYMYQGSYDNYFPCLSVDPPNSKTYDVFRCIEPQMSRKYKNAHTGKIN